MGQVIGRIMATESHPTTIDKFTFWTSQDLILNPFDIIKVEQVDGSFTYGTIEDIGHITDAQSFLTNFVSSDFGNLDSAFNTLRVGMNYVEAKVIYNDKDIYIPVQNDRKVMLADEKEIYKALGLDNIKNPLVCGYLEMYNGTKECEPIRVPVNLNAKFIIGPEGAHLNISGISGLAAKTSYCMFLLKAIQESYMKKDSTDDSVAFVLFNVKGCDLLALDQENDFSEESNPEKAKNDVVEQYKSLGLSPEPFKQVHYFYPFAEHKTNLYTYLNEEKINSNIKLKKASFFKYVYEDDKKNIDLMFSNIDDSTQTMDSILNYIISEQGAFAEGNISNWNEFLKEVQAMCKAKNTHGEKDIPVVSWRKFYRNVNKAIRGNEMFANRVDKTNNEVRLGEAIKHIKNNDAYVIDIAKLTEDKQAFVFGDVMRTISDLQLGVYDGEGDVNPPGRIIVFIDELNKYASKDTPKNSPILHQVLDVAERGRSLGIVLFAAEQFRSAIHDRVTGNCSTHAYGRTNTIELTKPDYRSIPNVYKNIMTRLQQGEYLIQNPVFRSLLSIKFPKPIYKQFK